jgi:hypothetical protein
MSACTHTHTHTHTHAHTHTHTLAHAPTGAHRPTATHLVDERLKDLAALADGDHARGAHKVDAVVQVVHAARVDDLLLGHGGARHLAHAQPELRHRAVELVWSQARTASAGSGSATPLRGCSQVRASHARCAQPCGGSNKSGTQHTCAPPYSRMLQLGSSEGATSGLPSPAVNAPVRVWRTRKGGAGRGHSWLPSLLPGTQRPAVGQGSPTASLLTAHHVLVGERLPKAVCGRRHRAAQQQR